VSSELLDALLVVAITAVSLVPIARFRFARVPSGDAANQAVPRTDRAAA
jgi:hypothetical protein